MNKGYTMFYVTKDGLNYVEMPRLKDFATIFSEGAPTEIKAIFRPGTAIHIDSIVPNTKVQDEFYFIYTDSSGTQQVVECTEPYKLSEYLREIYLDKYEPEDDEEEDDGEETFYRAFSSLHSSKVVDDRVRVLEAWFNYVNLRHHIKDSEDKDTLDAIVHRNLNLSGV